MKFGFRTPSIKRRISSRVSIKRNLVHRAGLKMPRGYGWVRNPKRYVYNKVYQRTTIGTGNLGWLIGAGTSSSKTTKVSNSNSQVRSTNKETVIDYSPYRLKSRNKKTALLLAVPLGIFGAHKFYYRRFGSAIVMLLISVTFYGLWITVPWLFVNIIKIALGKYDAEYDAKALVGKYEMVTESTFLEDYKWYKSEYPKCYSKHELFIFEQLTNKIKLDGNKHQQLLEIKEKCGFTNHTVINKLNKLNEYDKLIADPLEEIQVDQDLYNNELCHYISDCIWNEIRRNRSGVEYLKEMERGKILITNKRVVLFGQEKNKRIYLKRIEQLFPSEEGCYIEKDKGRNPFLTNLDAVEFSIQFQKVIKKYYSDLE